MVENVGHDCYRNTCNEFIPRFYEVGSVGVYTDTPVKCQRDSLKFEVKLMFLSSTDKCHF